MSSRFEVVKDYSGMRFGRLLVIARNGSSRHGGNAIWSCLCDCGISKDVLSTSLRLRDTQSCGCLQRELMSQRRTTHGHSVGGTTRTYNSWASMVARCSNQNYYQYGNYGGRGITVTHEWLKFERFLSDMGERPAGRTLGRSNNELGYSAANCRWATPKEQANNTRPRKDRVKHLMATVHGIHVREI